MAHREGRKDDGMRAHIAFQGAFAAARGWQSCTARSCGEIGRPRTNYILMMTDLGTTLLIRLLQSQNDGFIDCSGLVECLTKPLSKQPCGRLSALPSSPLWQTYGYRASVTDPFEILSENAGDREETHSTQLLSSPKPPIDAVAISSAESLMPVSFPDSHCHAVVEESTTSDIAMMAYVRRRRASTVARSLSLDGPTGSGYERRRGAVARVRQAPLRVHGQPDLRMMGSFENGRLTSTAAGFWRGAWCPRSTSRCRIERLLARRSWG